MYQTWLGKLSKFRYTRKYEKRYLTPVFSRPSGFFFRISSARRYVSAPETNTGRYIGNVRIRLQYHEGVREERR